MADKKSGKLLVPGQDGMFRAAVTRFKLIMRLLGDRRVSPWVKLIPIGALIYLISPIDLIMGVPGIDALDDAAVIWFGTSLFVELCPPNVVKEHLAEISGEPEEDGGDVIDADVTDVNDK